jgi:hypothetical protein
VSDSERVSCTRRVAAPAHTIFELVTDPHGQVKLDGSGMLVAPVDAKPMRAVGDVFVMDMDREPLGDVPMGRYTVQNTVTRIEPDRQLEWAPGLLGSDPFGHVYGYLLEPAGDSATDVTSYCDWTGVPEKWKAATTWPIVPLRMLEESLVNLDRLVTEPAG